LQYFQTPSPNFATESGNAGTSHLGRVSWELPETLLVYEASFLIISVGYSRRIEEY